MILVPDWNDREIHTNALIDAALQAVEPKRVVRNVLHRDGDLLHVGNRNYRLSDFKRVRLIGFGKAAAAMAASVEAELGVWLQGGLVITKYDHGQPLQRTRVLEAGHPLPDEAGVRGTRMLLDWLGESARDDLVLTLISGGGSALLVLPAGEISLADLQAVNAALLRSGATIQEFNTVRKHLSHVKGGQLARRLSPATVIALVISDVVGNPLDVIASGPLSPDPTTFNDARNILMSLNLWDDLSIEIKVHLEEGLKGAIDETPERGDPIFEKVQTEIVGDNRLASLAVVERARALGYNARLVTSSLEGEAREVAQMVVRLAEDLVQSDEPVSRPACLVLGGETTVTLRGDGQGGRNQELALAAAIQLAERDLQNVRFVCLATDGGDGPTDAAGAVVEATTIALGESSGLNARTCLNWNDSYPFLDAANALLRTGPTQTNVNDIIIVLVQ